MKKLHFAQIKTYGTSMLPILQNEDVVYLEKISFKEIAQNDIICYYQNKKYVTHRVIYTRQKFLITKGDNNFNADERVIPNQIIGKVYKIKRERRTIILDNIYLFQSSIYFKEIIKIKRQFEKERIDFLFLKGLPLHLHYEKAFPRRLYADCDVLINPNHFEKVETILLNEGYSLYSTALLRTDKKRKKRRTELSYYKKYKNLYIVFDIHFEPVFTIFQLNGLNALYPQSKILELRDDFLMNKQLIKIDNESFPILSPEHLIVYLCLHFFHDNYKGIYKLSFLNSVWQNHKKDQRVITRIQLIIDYYSLNNLIYPTLYFLKKYFDTKFPESIISKNKPSNLTFLFTRKFILSSIIFNNENNDKAAVKLFINLFFLSQSSLFKKIFVLINPEVVRSVIKITYKNLKNI